MICKAQIDITILFDDQVVELAFLEEATLADLERLMDDEAVGLTSVEAIPQPRLPRESGRHHDAAYPQLRLATSALVEE